MTVLEMLETNSIELKVYDLMRIAMIVGERFNTLCSQEKIDLDILLGEGEYDTYETLIDIALKIARNQFPTIDDGVGFTLEETRENADVLILKTYTKPPLKKYAVQRGYFKEVIVEANSREEAERIANEQHMFDNVTLEPGDTETSEIM